MAFADQIAAINFGSIATAGEGIRSLDLADSQLGAAVGEALSLSRTRALRMTRGLLESAPDVDRAARETTALVEWAATGGAEERRTVADAVRISGGELLLVDRISRLPRTEARDFIADWLDSGGDFGAVRSWLAIVGGVLRGNPEARHEPDHSGAVVDWVVDAVTDVVDAIAEAVETIVDAIVAAGKALVDFVTDIVNWTIEQVGNLVEALIEAGKTVGELVVEAVEAGVTIFKKVVKALIEIGRTVGEVLAEVVEQTVGALGDAIRALRDIAVSFGRILAAAAELVGDALRKVVETLIDIGQSVVQIIGAALEAGLAIVRATVEALLAIGRTVGQLVVDVITGRRSLIDAFTRAMRDIGQSVTDLLDAAAGAVAGAVGQIARSLADIGESVVDLVAWAADAAAGFAREVVAALVQAGMAVVSLVESLAGRAASLMRTLVDGLFAIGRTFTDLLREIGRVAVELLEDFLRAAFELGATILDFVAETFKNTYALAKKWIEAAVKAGAAIAELLVEAAKGTYYTLRKMVFGLMDVVGVGDIMRWVADRLEDFAENLFHEALTAIRYAGGRITEVLDWAADQTREVFRAVVDAWESVREDLIDLYRWASDLASDLAEDAWERIGRATVRFQNSVSYVLTYLENDFIPGVARFVRGLLGAGYEVADLVARVARRSVAFLVEVVRELLAAGVTIGELLVETVRNPRTALDNMLAAARQLDRSWQEILSAAETAGEDIVAEVVETGRRLEEPLSEMLDGALEVGGGLLGLVVEELFNLLGTYRRLTEHEKRVGDRIFQGSVDMDLVGISQESLSNDIIFGIQEWWEDDPRPFVAGTLINFDVDDDITDATLVHELTHVWQHLHEGPMYLSEALHAQFTLGDAAYAVSEDDLNAAGGDFDAFNPEQQGRIVERYHERKFESDPAQDVTAWEPYIEVVRAA